MSVPTACAAGYYCPEGASGSVSTRQPCPAGTYSDVAGRSSSLECIPCKAGQYCSTTALTAPEGDCAAGAYCPAGSSESNATSRTFSMGESVAGRCPAGYYCPTGTQMPLPCGPGTYSAVGASTCTSCPAGRYCRRYAVSDTDLGTYLCEAGYYCVEGSINPGGATSSSSDLALCQVGHYCPAGSAAAIQCPNGTYEPR